VCYLTKQGRAFGKGETGDWPRYSWKVPGHKIEVDLAKLTTIMVEHGWNQAEMAKAMGIHKDTLHRIMRRERKPSPSFVQRLLRI
jgi:transcriptional regulator of acetoin/glycerol metabolism